MNAIIFIVLTCAIVYQRSAIIRKDDEIKQVTKINIELNKQLQQAKTDNSQYVGFFTKLIQNIHSKDEQRDVTGET